jgi:hypothetical protein
MPVVAKNSLQQPESFTTGNNQEQIPVAEGDE